MSFTIYNNISLGNNEDIPSKAFLNVKHFIIEYTYQSMIEYKRIDDMNSNVKKIKILY